MKQAFHRIKGVFAKPGTRLAVLGVYACLLGGFFRLYPLIHYVSDDAREKASLLVMANLQQMIAAGVERDLPHLPVPQKRQLTTDELNKVIRNDKIKIQQAIHRSALTLDKSAPPGQTYPYLLGSDSFNYYDLTERIMETGTISPQIKGSKYFNDRMLAPTGFWEPFNLHPYIGYWLFRLLDFFSPGTPLMFAVSWTPLIIMTLSLLPFLWIAGQMGLQWAGTCVGITSLVLAPVFIKRGAFGWYDNDPYNIFFPLLLLALLIFGLQGRLSPKKRITAGLCLALGMALYALFWQGWVLFETLILASGITLILYRLIFKETKALIPGHAIMMVIFLVCSLWGIALFFGLNEFFILFQEGWKALKDFFRPQVSLWPNLYIAVGELKKSSLAEIIRMTGGLPVFLLAVIGLFTGLVNIFREEKSEKAPGFIVTGVFFLSSLLLSLSAMRFTLLCVVPLSVFAGIGMDALIRAIKKAAGTRQTRFAGPASTALGLCLVLGIAAFSSINAHQRLSTDLLNSIFNDTWKNMLEKIERLTPPDTIVNTWWPPGHFIKAVAKRRVTFDGATINFPQAYWLAHIFIETDERQALGLLRILNNCGNRAVEYLTDSGLPLPRAVEIIKKIAGLNKRQAGQALASDLRPGQITDLLALTHKPPPPSVFLLYNELIEKNVQMTFVGKWDFQKVLDVSRDPLERRKHLQSGIKNYVKFVWNMVGGEPRLSEPLRAAAVSNGQVVFEQNIKIDLEKLTCQVDSPKFGKGVPFSLFYLRDGRIHEKKFSDASLSYSVLLYSNDDAYFCVLADRNLARSFFIQLYLYEGQGLPYITPLGEERDYTKRTRLYAYQVDWKKFLEDLNKE